MPYIGNTIRAADDYRLIDDISSGFNGSETSFALQVAGSAPVPFPKSPQQVLISVNGVIQEPDPTGSSGFNLVGTNIVFSSAPTNGHAFFGIIYATADYLNAGGNFPAGSLGAPSITFIGDENTGLFRKSGGSVGLVSDATEIANFDSNGITISSGNIIIPDSIIHNGDTNTKIRFPAADTVTIETGGSERLRVESSGRFLLGHTSDIGYGFRSQLVGTDGNTSSFAQVRFTNSVSGPTFVMAKSRNGTPGSKTIVNNNDNLGEIQFRADDGVDYFAIAASINAEVDGTPGAGDMPGRLVFSTTADGAEAATERMRIASSGHVGIGTTSPVGRLHVHNSGTGSGDHAYAFFTTGDTGATANDGLTIGVAATEVATINYREAGAISFGTSSTERMRLDSAGRLMIGTTTEGHASADDFTIASSASTGITIRSGTTSEGNIFFSDGTSGASEYAGFITYDHSNNSLRLTTNATERMRIDSSGKVGINETNPTEMLHIKAEDNTDSFGGLIIKANNNSVHMKYGWRGLDANGGGDIRFSVGGTEMMRVLSSGKVGLGRTSADEMLHIVNDDNTDGFGGIKIDANNGSINCKYGWLGADGSNSFRIGVAGTERMRVANDGKVGIGLTTPDQLLHIYQQSGSSQAYVHVQNNRSRNAAIKFTTTQGSWLVGQGIGNDNDRFAIYDTAERFVLNSSGNVGIGTASPTERLHVSGTTRATQLLINTSGGHNSSRVHIVGHSTGSHTNIRCANSAGTQLFLVRNDNACFVGNLSKNSGSFFIPHPLPSLAATKTLRHSFIEGPQCDNIYRGKVTLSSGTASINLDTVSKMTEGTFVVLNRDVQCFTSNETGWNAVKGSVTGNILTITCENNSSTDTISWMVVGERQDPGIKESTITDDDGYLLVEEDKEDEVV